jgi:AraC-like DNA-binding protein
MAATVPAVGLRALLKALHRLHLPSTALLSEVGLDEAALQDPDARVATEQADALWAAAYRRSGDERLAMHAVQQLQAGDYRTLTYLAAHCATVGEGVRRVIGFFDLIDRRIRWTLDDTGDPVLLRLQFAGMSDPLPRPPVEYTLGAFVVSLRLTTGVDWRPMRVEVGFPRPGDEAAAEHAALLGPVDYGSTVTRLAVSRHWWRHPTPHADATLVALLSDLAGRRLQDLATEDDDDTRLATLLGESLVGGPPSLSETARRLGLSNRSLQRKLADRGTSFREEVARVRKQRAEMMLEDPNLALCEVSWLLGFSDPRAFTRAFRRWHGTTPSEWRRGRSGPVATHAS